MTNERSTAEPMTGSAWLAPFERSASFSTAFSPSSIRSGLFNTDLIPDLVIVNKNHNELTIHLGRGNGSFEPKTTYQVENNDDQYQLRQAATGDFNGDGRTDIIARGRSVSILYGRGDGTFDTPAVVTTGQAIAAGRSDGDTIDDFVVGDASGLWLWRGRAGGGFVERSQVATVALKPEFFADLNGDGAQDLVGWEAAPGHWWMLAGDGNGTFAEPVQLPLRSASVADLNSDGMVDLVGLPTARGAFSMALGGGNGSFGLASDVGEVPILNERNGTIWSVLAERFDAGPTVDVLVVTGFAVGLYLGRGDGTFDAAGYRVALEDADPFAAVAATDLDGDSKADFAYTIADGGSGTVWLTNQSSGVAPTTTFTLIPAVPDGLNGWYKSPVVVGTEVADGDLHGYETSWIAAVESVCALDPLSVPATYDELAAMATSYQCHGLSDGVHVMYRAARDIAGNGEVPVATPTLHIDTAPPVVTIAGPIEGTRYPAGGVPAASCGASDTTSGLASQCRLGKVTVANRGRRTLVAMARDRAGNIGSTKVTYWEGDAAVSVNFPSTAPEGNMRLNITASGAPPFQFEWDLNGDGAFDDADPTETSLVSSRFNWLVPDDRHGPFVLAVRMTDATGATTIATSAPIEGLNRPPSGQLRRSVEIPAPTEVIVRGLSDPGRDPIATVEVRCDGEAGVWASATVTSDEASGDCANTPVGSSVLIEARVTDDQGASQILSQTATVTQNQRPVGRIYAYADRSPTGQVTASMRVWDQTSTFVDVLVCGQHLSVRSGPTWIQVACGEMTIGDTLTAALTDRKGLSRTISTFVDSPPP